tara:strand:- start:290 stop:1267 length:978 start_codon:yes stop_codon:yes gene_type:complete
MTVNSESFFRKISSKDEALDERERKIKLREDRLFNLQQSMMSVDQINPEQFFEQGRQQGVEEGMQLGLQQAAESAEKFNQGGLVPNKSGSFEFSIGRDEETGNIIKESFFGDTETIEETSDDGSFYSREETTVKGAGFITKFFERSSEDGLEEKQTLTERVLSIGVSDLIEHQDQLLGEIHKIDGFENVTIDDVLNGTTGLSKDQLFNILFNSDASMATGEKKDSNTDIGEELIMSSSSFTSQTQERYNSGNLVKADAEEAKSFNDLANSINQSVNTTKVKTVIQPINTITTKTVSNPVPTPVPVPATGVNVVTRDRKKSIAHKL